jgi:hypothetical protein
VPDPPRVDVPPPLTRPTLYAATANTPPSHLAQGAHVYVCVGGQHGPLVAPYAGPYLVVSKGAKSFTIQVGQRQDIISVDWLKANTGLGPVSPAGATSRGRPPKIPTAPSVQPAPSWGFRLGMGLLYSRLNIFIHNMCLTNYGAREAIYLCNVMKTNTLDLKCASVFRE